MTESGIAKKVADWMVAEYPGLGSVAAAELEKWRSGQVPYACPEILDQHLKAAHPEILEPRSGKTHLKLLFDAFYQLLPFGTGGRRGPVGYGSNRINPSTVAMTIQGHCDYLHKTFPDRRDLAVVVANDVRVFKDIANIYDFLDKNHPLIGVSSRSLGTLACTIYAANGIVAYFADPGSDQAVLTTPELSFLIRRLRAGGGINLSASHNPPDDNGVKVYDEFGSQPVAPNDQVLVDAMRDVKVREMPFQDALEKNLIRDIPPKFHQEYKDAYVKEFGRVFIPHPDLPIVYTPLCGCGLTTVGETMTQVGFPWRTPPRQGPDGTFTEIPFKAPNPEVPEATNPAKDYADEIGAGVVLCSDPDADRIGLEAKLADQWYHFDGNQISAILCYFLMLDPKGPRRKGLVIETLVTTRLLGEIVKRSPGSQIIDDLLVGFKYVADVLKSLELTGSYRRSDGEVLKFKPEDLVLAAEESHGVIVLPTIRDKDSTPACLYLAALYQRLRQEGRTLFDYYLQIIDELGGHDATARSIMMRGADGVARRDRIMSSLRKHPPTELDGQRINPADIVDHWDERKFGRFKSETDKLPRNVIQYSTENCIVTIRPSGTEPKIKLYCHLLPHEERSGLKGLQFLQELRNRSERYARLVYGDLLERAGLERLNEAALLLPDIVAYESKAAFQNRTEPELHKGLIAGRWTSLNDLLAWLHEQARPMTPGADPLPALKGSVSSLCQDWSSKMQGVSMLSELEKWTRA